MRLIDSSIPDGDGEGEDGLSDGDIEVHHHCLRQVEIIQLLQEVHPLLGFFGQGADVQLQLEGVMMVPRKWRDSGDTVSTAESLRVMGVYGAGFFL